MNEHPCPVSQATPDASARPERTPPPLFLLRSVAAMFGVCPDAVRHWVKQKTFPPHDYCLAGAQLWSRTTVEAAIQAGIHRVAADASERLTEGDIRRGSSASPTRHMVLPSTAEAR